MTVYQSALDCDAIWRESTGKILPIKGTSSQIPEFSFSQTGKMDAVITTAFRRGIAFSTSFPFGGKGKR
jgi:hypothetical protein